MTLTGKIIRLNRSKTEGIIEVYKEEKRENIKFKLTSGTKPLFIHARYRFTGTIENGTFLVDDINGVAQELRNEDITEIFPTLTIQDIDALRAHFNTNRLGDLLTVPNDKLTQAAYGLLDEEKADAFIDGIIRIRNKQDYIEVWELINKSNPVIDINTVIKIVKNLNRRASMNESSVYMLLKHNPWLLLQTEAFETVSQAQTVANNIADHLGYSHKDRKSIISCAIAHTYMYTQNGHSYIPYYSLVGRVAGMMKISMNEVKEALNSETKDSRTGYLIRYNQFSEEVEKKYVDAVSQHEPEKAAQYVGYSVYLPKIFIMEKYISEKLSEIIKSPPEINKGRYLEYFIRENNSLLTDEQKEAVLSVPNNRITVITGSAGTGKTATIKLIKGILAGAGYQPVVLAPTGIASQRIAPGEGSTIHRYAHIFDDRDIVFDNVTGLDEDKKEDKSREVIIVDEMSMITVPVFAKLLSATEGAAAYVFVGDPNQLPPIGAGGVFQTLIELGNTGIENIRTVRLSKVFRTTNSILTHAEAVINNQPIQEDENLKIIEAANWKEISIKVVETIKELLNSGVKYEDIMVLSDKRGEGRTGTSLLNQVIREQIFGIRTRDYKEGDIIIAVRNDYETHGAFFKNRAIERYTRTIRHKDRPTIFNGSVGVIKEIDEANASVLIEYINPRVEARYNLEELDWYIEHGYAITVHKAQGGQAKYVIFAALEPDKISREKLYTALTRSQDKVYLVGGTKAAWQAGKKQQYVLTKLKYKILQELEGKLEESKKTAGSRVRLVE